MSIAATNGRSPRREHTRKSNGIAGDACFYCGSPITSASVHARIAAQEKLQAEAIERALTENYGAQMQTAIERARKDAAKAADTQIKALRKDQADAIAAAVTAEREKAGKSASEAVTAAKLEHAAEKLKLEQQLGDLQRKLAAKPAHAIGQPAEIDLHRQISMMLATVAREDRVSRVPPGKEGADVVVEIIEHGEACGKLIVESKNHKTWKASFTSRLRQVQIREGAAFAILSSPIFWAGAPPHIALRDGVLCARPECVPVLVTMLRQIVVDNHKLSLTASARDDKANRALLFVCSPMCNELMAQLLKLTDSLGALDEREKSVHFTTWNRRADLVQRVIAVREQFVRFVTAIISGDEP